MPILISYINLCQQVRELRTRFKSMIPREVMCFLKQLSEK